MPVADLATLEGLTEAADRRHRSHATDTRCGSWDGTFCSSCGDKRRMELIQLHAGDSWLPTPHRDPETGDPLPPTCDMREPSLFVAGCRQCGALLTLVVHLAPNGPAVVAVPESYGGLAKPNTPAGVAYYLDQAQRSQAIGALSGAVAMYRAALEHLLHDQGYTNGMLGARIAELMADPKPPSWRDRMDRGYLDAINRLGNAAIHANDGDVRQQATFDAEILREVRELFVELLDEIYERPAIKASRLGRLQTAADSIKRK